MEKGIRLFLIVKVLSNEGDQGKHIPFISTVQWLHDAEC
jgi:hypothetical protein